MRKQFSDGVLNALSQLPQNTVILVNPTSIDVYKDSRDLEDGVAIHRFFKTTLWVDQNDTSYYQIQGAMSQKGD